MFKAPKLVELSGNLTAVENISLSLNCNYTDVVPPGNETLFVFNNISKLIKKVSDTFVTNSLKIEKDLEKHF